jgi:transcriptional regulator with XRE-family HTH domain
MPVNVNEIIRKLSPAERKKVEDRAAEIIAEEMSLRDLRKARKLTQARIAKKLGITQDSVSRIEKRSDLLLSTLRKTVKAMGGDVRIVAEFPDRAPVVLTKLSEDEPPRKSARRHAQVPPGLHHSKYLWFIQLARSTSAPHSKKDAAGSGYASPIRVPLP